MRRYKKCVACNMCAENFTTDELNELHEMGEKFYFDVKSGTLFCPDCFDCVQRLPLEQQLEYLFRE